MLSNESIANDTDTDQGERHKDDRDRKGALVLVLFLTWMVLRVLFLHSLPLQRDVKS